jgi:hypothetical protein
MNNLKMRTRTSWLAIRRSLGDAGRALDAIVELSGSRVGRRKCLTSVEPTRQS